MDLLRSSYDRDMSFMILNEITDNDEAEAKLLIKHSQINYEMLTEIYHFL